MRSRYQKGFDDGLKHQDELLTAAMEGWITAVDDLNALKDGLHHWKAAHDAYVKAHADRVELGELLKVSENFENHCKVLNEFILRYGS